MWSRIAGEQEYKSGLPRADLTLKHQGVFILLCGSLCFFFLLAAVWFACFFIDLTFLRGLEKDFKVIKSYDQILLLCLAMVVASFTFAITIWRGYQTNEQTHKTEELTNETKEQVRLAGIQVEETQNQVEEARKQAELLQKQVEEARFQNALEMATEKFNAGRCVSGLRTLEDMYEDRGGIDKETIHSVALYVLSIERDEKDQIKQVSKTARQRALDILVKNGRFLSQEKLEKSEKGEDGNSEMPVRDSMIGKDLSLLYLARQSAEEDSSGNKILNLSGFSFRDSNFGGANLSGIILQNAELTGTDLHGTNLSGARIVDVIGLPVKHLGWSYYLREPLLKVIGWDEWVEYVKSMANKPFLYMKEPDIEILNTPELHNTLSQLTLSVQLASAKGSDTIYATRSELENLEQSLGEHEKIPDHQKHEDFWKFMNQEAWDFLKSHIEKLVDPANKYSRYFEVRRSIAREWSEWKNFINKKDEKDKPDSMTPEVWQHLRRLAAEDAKYPLGEDRPKASKI